MQFTQRRCPPYERARLVPVAAFGQAQPHSPMTRKMNVNPEFVTSDSPTDSTRRQLSDTLPGNLPSFLVPLLGRERETTALRQLLARADVPLVTITGPGGVGKTSLALHVARDAQEFFPDGVFFISLAPISDPTLILPTIAQTLNLPESPRRMWLDMLKDYLRDRHVLLLLDNFEQIAAAAPLLTELLSASVGLRMLVTSRGALRVRGEQEFVLSPLALPDQPTVETLLQCPSIALFVQRAQSAQLEFQLTNRNAADVTEICARLDGLPLALELAAARIKMFPPRAMLGRLRESPLQLLTRGARDLPERQQTLRCTVQWSYDLLDAEEQRAFRRFSVFVGGSTPEAALAVLGPPISPDVLESLASQSLVRQIETNETARLVMLETIREFGLEHLTLAAESEAARRAHAEYYLSFAEQAERELRGAEQKTWLENLDREQDNLRAALRWALEHHQVEFAQRMASALQPFWFARTHWSEGRRWLEQALDLDPNVTAIPTVHAKALYGAGRLARYQGDLARARMLCESSLALYRTLADNAGVVMSLVQLSRISDFQRDENATQNFLSEAAVLIETLPDSVVKADAYTDMVIANYGSDTRLPPATLAHYLAESERIQRSFNNEAGLAFALLHQANSALIGGDYARAAPIFAEAERLAMGLGDDRLLSRLALSHMPLDIHTGDFATARRRVQDTLQKGVTRGDHHLPSALTMLAIILQRQGLAIWSARVLGLAESQARTPAEVAAITGLLHLWNSRTEVRAQLGEEEFARELEAGKLLTLNDVWAIPNPPAPAAPTPIAATSASGTALTARELEVLRLLAQDLSNPQIAERLIVSRRTVDAHLRSVYDKLDVKSRDAAIRVAKERGLISNL